MQVVAFCHTTKVACLNWIWVISGRCCRDEMERSTVVYDHCNKLKDVDRDKEPILVIFLCFRVRCMTASGKGMCHQKPSKMQSYPPAPSRQLSPKAVKVGIRGMMWAMGVSHTMPDSGSSFSRKKSISWHIVLLILYWNFAWWTRWAALFIAKLICFTWSFTEQGKEPVLRERQILRNSGDVSVGAALENFPVQKQKKKLNSCLPLSL